MFEGGYEYDNPEAIFNTIIANNHEIFHYNIDNEISNDINSLMTSTSSTIINDIPTTKYHIDNIVINDNHNSIDTEHYLEFLCKLDQESIPNQLGNYKYKYNNY
jgi:hypothetical protein